MKPTLFVHEPDELFDCGDLGDHPIKYTALIEYRGEDRHGIQIVSAQASIWHGAGVTEVPALFFINKYPETKRKIEDEIIYAYERARESSKDDWDGGPNEAA